MNDLQGGLKAVIWTDVFQAGVMIVGILIIVIQVIAGVLLITFVLSDSCNFRKHSVSSNLCQSLGSGFARFRFCT